MKKYDTYMTPYEKLKSLTNAKQYLKDRITFDDLDKLAYNHSDIEFAEMKDEAKKKVFQLLKFPPLQIALASLAFQGTFSDWKILQKRWRI